MHKSKKRDKKMMKKNKKNLKAQAWSIDIVIGVILFLVLIVVVYTLVATSPLGDLELRRSADMIHSKFDKDKSTDSRIPTIFSKDRLDETTMEELASADYKDIKNALGITGDFCIVITYVDEGIHNITDTKMSFGNPDDEVAIAKNTSGGLIYCGD